MGALVHGDADRISKPIAGGRLIEKVIVVFAPAEPASETPAEKPPESKIETWESVLAGHVFRPS
jgi:hypothetical protein